MGWLTLAWRPEREGETCVALFLKVACRGITSKVCILSKTLLVVSGRERGLACPGDLEVPGYCCHSTVCFYCYPVPCHHSDVPCKTVPRVHALLTCLLLCFLWLMS